VARVTFDQSSAVDYKFVHGRAPRGKGLWSFELGDHRHWTTFWFDGTYTDAKRAAMKQARTLQLTTVVVNS